VDEIMNYYLIETNGFVLMKEATDMSVAVDNIEKLYKPFSKAKAKAKAKDLAVQNRVDREVFLDKNKFEQIFGNLISNALKFTLEGGLVNAGLDLLNGEGDGYYLKLTVQDNGIGMEPEKASALFGQSSKLSRSGTSGEKARGWGYRL